MRTRAKCFVLIVNKEKLCKYSCRATDSNRFFCCFFCSFSNMEGSLVSSATPGISRNPVPVTIANHICTEMP